MPRDGTGYRNWDRYRSRELSLHAGILCTGLLSDLSRAARMVRTRGVGVRARPCVAAASARGGV